jgi:ubiquinone/menaquinone biosynthesis C-methylase UbiE
MSALPSRYIRYQKKILEPHLLGMKNLLDFGCGDMALAKELVRNSHGLRVTGVDVVKTAIPKNPRLKFVLYDGKTLPFPDNSFDVSMAYHVFHHIREPEKAFSELVRVTKKRIILVEPILRFPFEKFGFMIADIFGNLGRENPIAMPFTVKTREWWMNEFLQQHLNVTEEKHVSVLPSFLPIGVTRLFVIEKYRGSKE